MSVEDRDVVDILSIDKQTGDVVLTVSDHLDWCDSLAHQETLQNKVNRYLAFIESGELIENCPDAKERSVIIKVALKFPPDASGREFLSRAESVVTSAGIGFRCKVFAESHDN